MPSTTSLSWADHSTVLAGALSSLHSDTADSDLLLLCQGRHIPVHRMVLAASSPFLAGLLQEADTALSLDGMTYSEVRRLLSTLTVTNWVIFQAQLAVQFMYKGVVERLSQAEIDSFLCSVAHLEISGLAEQIFRSQTELENAMEDDDVFSDQAVDLSPVNRHPPTPLLSGNLDLATRRMASLSKISEALQRNSESASSKSGSSCGAAGGDQKASRSSTSSSSDSRGSFESFRDKLPSQDRFLNRIKKPKPLTNLPKPGADTSAIYLKPRTPRTPLLISPDCQVLEERFRNLIEGNSADTEKLRNLSVSSADFNFEAGGSLPNTPIRTPRTFNFPPSASAVSAAPAATSGTLDLSIKKIGSETDSDGETTDKIPTINVIKPEPEDVEESEGGGHSPPSCFQFVCSKSSPDYPSDSQASPSAVKTEAPTYFFPQFPLPFSYTATPPSPPLSPGPQPYRLKLPSPAQTEPGPGPSPPTNNKNKKDSGKQAFKCGKCGKSYNWNYNLNRHMRFECGIQNRFECSMCQKRFPYKQNVAIHLKRKHKLQMDNADDMIAQGHITLLPLEKNEEKS